MKKQPLDKINEQLQGIKELIEKKGLGIACLSTDYEMENYKLKERVKELEQQDSEEINPFAFKVRFVESNSNQCSSCCLNKIFCNVNNCIYFNCASNTREDNKTGYFEKI